MTPRTPVPPGVRGRSQAAPPPERARAAAGLCGLRPEVPRPSVGSRGQGHPSTTHCLVTTSPLPPPLLPPFSHPFTPFTAAAPGRVTPGGQGHPSRAGSPLEVRVTPGGRVTSARVTPAGAAALPLTATGPPPVVRGQRPRRTPSRIARCGLQSRGRPGIARCLVLQRITAQDGRVQRNHRRGHGLLSYLPAKATARPDLLQKDLGHVILCYREKATSVPTQVRTWPLPRHAHPVPAPFPGLRTASWQHSTRERQGRDRTTRSVPLAPSPAAVHSQSLWGGPRPHRSIVIRPPSYGGTRSRKATRQTGRPGRGHPPGGGGSGNPVHAPLRPA